MAAFLKVLWNIVKKVFCFVFVILSPLKRLFCRRKRNPSDTLLPLSNHYTIPPDFNQTPGTGAHDISNDLQSWDAWENDATTNSKSASNHQQLSRSRSQQDSVSEPEIDYFEDMTPEIRKQRKVLIKKKNDSAMNTGNRFAVSSDTVPLSVGGELGAWEETDGGWEKEAEEDLSWQAEIAIKEKRRSERKERNIQQQKRKQEKDNSKSRSDGFSAVRLS